MEKMVNDVAMRMAFLRYLLKAFDTRWGYEMPDVVRLNSREYLDENNPLCAFVSDHVTRVEADTAGVGAPPFFTLLSAKELFKRVQPPARVPAFKQSLEKALGVACKNQHWHAATKKNVTNAFLGWRLVYPEERAAAGLPRRDLSTSWGNEVVGLPLPPHLPLESLTSL
jgi:hypothetical protein